MSRATATADVGGCARCSFCGGCGGGESGVQAPHDAAVAAAPRNPRPAAPPPVAAGVALGTVVEAIPAPVAATSTNHQPPQPTTPQHSPPPSRPPLFIPFLSSITPSQSVCLFTSCPTKGKPEDFSRPQLMVVRHREGSPGLLRRRGGWQQRWRRARRRRPVRYRVEGGLISLGGCGTE